MVSSGAAASRKAQAVLPLRRAERQGPAHLPDLMLDFLYPSYHYLL